MKKKQETVGKKSSVTKLGFDTTTALNSKRKSKNYWFLKLFVLGISQLLSINASFD